MTRGAPITSCPSASGYSAAPAGITAASHKAKAANVGARFMTHTWPDFRRELYVSRNPRSCAVRRIRHGGAGRGRRSVPHERRAPGEPAAERFEQQQIAALHAPVADG